MPRKLIAIGLVTAGLGVGATGASANRIWHRCPDEPSNNARDIEVTAGTTCETARHLTYHWAHPRGHKDHAWSCKWKGTHERRGVLCRHRADHLVTWWLIRQP